VSSLSQPENEYFNDAKADNDDDDDDDDDDDM
jgi:hypothetical protein